MVIDSRIFSLSAICSVALFCEQSMLYIYIFFIYIHEIEEAFNNDIMIAIWIHTIENCLMSVSAYWPACLPCHAMPCLIVIIVVATNAIQPIQLISTDYYHIICIFLFLFFCFCDVCSPHIICAISYAIYACVCSIINKMDSYLCLYLTFERTESIIIIKKKK
jgi:hypothetical protein